MMNGIEDHLIRKEAKRRVIEQIGESCLQRRHRRKIALRVVTKWLVLKEKGRIANQRTGQNFNPLRRIPVSEPIHSRLIGDFLTPNGDHGQGTMFLRAFLVLIGVPHPDLGIWEVAVERGNVDICLARKAPKSVVIIENKSNWALDQRSQLYRYWDSHVHRKYPGMDYLSQDTRDHFKLIYLIPHVTKLLERQSRVRPVELNKIPAYADFPEVPLEIQPLLLRDLFATWGSLPIPEENQRLKSFLAFYAELWQNSGHDD